MSTNEGYTFSWERGESTIFTFINVLFITVRGKVMFSQACVKNSVHGGGGVSQHALGLTPPCPVHARIHPGQTTPRQTTPPGRPTSPPPRADIPTAQCMLGYMHLGRPLQRTVHILPECIPVSYLCVKYQTLSCSGVIINCVI